MNIFYRDLNEKDFENILVNEVYENINFAIGINLGHTNEMHINQTTNDIIKRMKDEEKSDVSCFFDKDTADDAILNAVVYKAAEITQWIHSRMGDFSKKQDFQEYAISLCIDSEPIGKGLKLVNGEYHEFESPSVRIVLQRDFDNITPFGFYIKTAYCDICSPEATETGIIYTKDDIINEKIIDFRSDMEKIAFKNADKYKNVTVRCHEDSDTREDILKVTYFEPDCKYVSYITDNGEVNNYKISNNGRRKLEKDEIPLRYNKILDEIESEIDEVVYRKNNISHEDTLSAKLEEAYKMAQDCTNKNENINIKDKTPLIDEITR